MSGITSDGDGPTAMLVLFDASDIFPAGNDSVTAPTSNAVTVIVKVLVADVPPAVIVPISAISELLSVKSDEVRLVVDTPEPASLQVNTIVFDAPIALVELVHEPNEHVGLV